METAPVRPSEFDPFPDSDGSVSVPSAGASPRAVLDTVLRVRESVQRESERILPSWNSVITLADFRASAENLARYLALRTHDLSELQPSALRARSFFPRSLRGPRDGKSRRGDCRPFPYLRRKRGGLSRGLSLGRRRTATRRPTSRAFRPKQGDDRGDGDLAQRGGDRRRVGREPRCRGSGLCPDKLRARRREGVGRDGGARQERGGETRSRLPHPNGPARSEVPSGDAFAGQAETGARRGPILSGGRAARSDPGRARRSHGELSRCRRAPAGRFACLDRRRQDPLSGRRAGGKRQNIGSGRRPAQRREASARKGRQFPRPAARPARPIRR